MSSNAKKQALSALEQLKEKTIVVADTGDFEGIELILTLIFHFYYDCDILRLRF